MAKVKKKKKSVKVRASKKIECSKKITIASFILFIACIVAGVILAMNDKDVSIMEWIIGLSGGNLGLTVSFYMNKAKQENTFKIFRDMMNMESKIKNEDNEEMRNEIKASVKNELLETINKNFSR